ncbi:MAG: hypothetical protein GQ559_08540 [Desulfobulbaceae bacterium]|nr:hypothetical protein [Desulfobulbaceae bacterium]
MKKKYMVLVGGILLATAGSCLAEQGNLDIGVKGGTLGGGVEMGVGLTDNLNLRAGVNYLKFSFDSTISNIDYEMEPEFKNGSLLLDWYPFSGVFRLTGGMFINNNEISLSGKPRLDTYLAGFEVPAEYAHLEYLADTVRVNGTVDFNTLAPFVGIGWNSNRERTQGWGIACELGVLFQGAPSVSTLSATADEPLGSYADHPVVVSALDQERQAIEDDLENFQYYPVASIMLNYTF